ncbi:calcyclin-binding protein-like [Vigna unguiculata]|uniref:Calcyclin-binding protein n=1 Tax=Vigna unguiculata TaxID=3917 RepID=A0A4D6L331_VIGUN|nr:calcyclin-binding protein-like [Vigna unguiculata]QCD82922.1 calcyclin binding protein [Vigna unguiculata]
MAQDLTLDLEELHHLHSIAKRPRTLSLLSSEIRNLEKISSDANAARAPQIPTPISTGAKVSPSPALNYSTLASFSWDQDGDKVKIYVLMEGIDENKIESEFKSMSFDVKFHDVQGKNYRCAISKLHKEIVPEKCKVLVKPKRAIITLVKASKGNWLDLHFKEDKLKPNLDKEKDPMAGIMDMMKNMYEEGDDEMKKTIAKAWTDARSGKTADPLGSYR